jgi:hypothetical protein
MSQKLYLIQKPKNCSIKVYVYNSLAQYYPPATTLKTSFNLPTLSQAFEEFLNDNYYLILGDNDIYRFHYEFATPFNLKVSWDTKRKWDSLPKAKKIATLFRFNESLWWRIQSIYGGEGV